MKATCPNDKRHKRFVTTVREVHEWLVDDKGEMVRDLGCLEVERSPDAGNLWMCRKCGAEARVEAEEGVGEG